MKKGKKPASRKRVSDVRKGKSAYKAPKATFVARKQKARLLGCGDSETLCTTTYHT